MTFKKIHSNQKFTLLSLIILVTAITVSDTISTSPNPSLSFEKVSNSIVTSISINNDTDFSLQALNHGWSGNGSATNPYIIQNYIFDNLPYTSPLISIKNTESYFSLLNITINGGSYGVYFENVSNAHLSNLTISNPSNNNIYFIQCRNNTISDSFISKSGKLDHNILIDYSTNITIKNTKIIMSAFSGIKFRDSNSSLIINNSIQDNKNSGIVLGHTTNITIKDNIISNNLYRGASIEGSSINTTLENNLFQNNGESGLFLISINTIVFNNTFYNNTYWGLSLDSSSTNTIVTYNNFIENYITSSFIQQIADTSQSSYYDCNFFDEITGPDQDNNGIVDQPYQIVKDSDNYYDYNSQTTVYRTSKIHLVTRPNGISIAGDLPYSGSVEVSWNKSSDTLGHKITYSIYYLDIIDNQWINLAYNHTLTSYTLDTTMLQDTRTYLLRIDANDSYGKSNSAILNQNITVQNQIISSNSESITKTTNTTNFEFMIFGLGSIILISINRSIRKKK